MNLHPLDTVRASLGIAADDPRFKAVADLFDAAVPARFLYYPNTDRLSAALAKLLPDDVLVIEVRATDPDPDPGPVVAQAEPRSSPRLPDEALTSRQRAARYREQDEAAFKDAITGMDMQAVKDALARSGRGYTARQCPDGMIEVLDTSGTPMVRCAASQALDMVSRMAPQRTALIGAID